VDEYLHIVNQDRFGSMGHGEEVERPYRQGGKAAILYERMIAMTVSRPTACHTR
jgi:hypothetical protein